MNDGTHRPEIFASALGDPLGAVRAGLKERRNHLLILLAVSVAAGAALTGAYWALVSSGSVSTDNAYVGAATAQINAQISGPIAEVRVDDTQMVHKGDVLVVIDQSNARLAVARAEAEYRHTLQRVAQYYAQEAVAAAQAQAKRAELARAEEDYGRRKTLARSGFTSQEALTAARTAYEIADANLAVAQQSLEAALVLTRGFTPDDHPETVAARAVLDAAQLDLERAVIRAPLDGVVAQRKAQVGQSVAPGQPLMAVTPIQAAYVDANFKEGQLRHVRIGQPVELTSDLYGEGVVYHGRVAGLGGGTGSAFAIIPAQNATGNWIKVIQRVPVRIALDPAEIAARPLRVGLSMTARIDTRKAGK